MDHPEITSFDIWISFQSDSLLATAITPTTLNSIIPGGTGDFDQNGKTNAADLPVMLSALTDLNVYKANHMNLTDSQLAGIGDFDGDGKVTNADIQKFLAVLAAGTGTGCPRCRAGANVGIAGADRTRCPDPSLAQATIHAAGPRMKRAGNS